MFQYQAYAVPLLPISTSVPYESSTDRLVPSFPDQHFFVDPFWSVIAGPEYPAGEPIPTPAPELSGVAGESFDMPAVELPIGIYAGIAVNPELTVLPPDPLPTASAEPV